jgi:ATP-dependent DNA helicase HFM1/MER3
VTLCCIVAPIKALCSERFNDWQAKFDPLGLSCCELTGDSQLDDYFELQNAQIVMTTPVRIPSLMHALRLSNITLSQGIL